MVPKVRGCAAVVSKKSQGKDALENLKVLSKVTDRFRGRSERKISSASAPKTATRTAAG